MYSQNGLRDSHCLSLIGMAVLAACAHTVSAAVPGVAMPKDFKSVSEAVQQLSPEGGEVYIPAGRYVLNETIIVGDNVTLRGAGRQTILVAGEGMDAYYQKQKCYRDDEEPKAILDMPAYRHGAIIKNRDEKGNAGIRIYDLAIEGNRDNVKYPTGILFSNVSDAIIRGVRVSDCGASGIALLGSREVRITESTIERNHNGIVIVGEREKTRDILVSGCTIRNNRWTGIFALGSSAGKKQEQGFLYDGPHNLIITNNFIYDHTNDDGIKLFGCRYVIASGNRIDRAEQCGIESHSSRDCVFNNNIVTRIDNGQASEGVGICPSRSRPGMDVGYAAVVGNVIADCGAFGVWNEDARGRGITTVGNVTYGNCAAGMGAGCMRDGTFVGNVCLDQGRYGAKAPKGRDTAGMIYTAGAKRISVMANVIVDEREGERHLMQNGMIIRGSSAIQATHNIIGGGTVKDISAHSNQGPIRTEENMLLKDLNGKD